MNSDHNIVPNIKFGSLLLLILHLITIISTEASQSFDKPPDGEYLRLRAQTLDIPCLIRHREGECLWIRNGAVISPINGKYQFERQPTNGDCTLHIQNLDLIDNGSWQCQVTSPSVQAQSLQSNLAKVVVLVAPNPPQLIDPKSDKEEPLIGTHLSINADRSQQIDCISLKGNPAPRIEWYINGENVTQNSETNVDSPGSFFPKVKSTLRQTFKKSHNNATISCKSVHPVIFQNSSAIINVLYIPKVTVSKKKHTVNDGSSLKVECLVDSNPLAEAIWKNLDGKVETNEFSNEYRTNSLVIPSVTKKMNEAQFACSARNSLGASEDEIITLDVLYEPTLLKASPTNQVINLGESVELFCEYDGNPPPKIMWFHINPITDQVRNRPNDEQEQSVLKIANVSYNDEGHYYCEALNHNSITDKDIIVRSSKIVVDVRGKPSVIQKLEVTNGYRSTDTDIEQLFCSDPPPTSVYWTFGSLRIDVQINGNPSAPAMNPSSNLTKTLRQKARSLIAMDKHGLWPQPTCFRAVLTILNTDINDERDYTLNVENQMGKSESIIKLRVISPVSAAIMITIGLIVLIMLLALTLVTLLVIKRRKLAKEKADDESKAEARAPMKSDTDKPEKEPEKTKGDNNHELVYANLDFAKTEIKPTKAKPTAQQRQHKTNGGNSGTEYAQITFANKADL